MQRAELRALAAVSIIFTAELRRTTALDYKVTQFVTFSSINTRFEFLSFILFFDDPSLYPVFKCACVCFAHTEVYMVVYL